MIVAFLAAFVLNINVVIIIIASGVIGAVSMLYLGHIKKSGEIK
jgi:hypothetical protein